MDIVMANEIKEYRNKHLNKLKANSFKELDKLRNLLQDVKVISITDLNLLKTYYTNLWNNFNETHLGY
jgi:hypothetical protein